MEKDLDQIHVPDLTMEDITMLKRAVKCLREEMAELEQQNQSQEIAGDI